MHVTMSRMLPSHRLCDSSRAIPLILAGGGKHALMNDHHRFLDSHERAPRYRVLNESDYSSLNCVTTLPHHFHPDLRAGFCLQRTQLATRIIARFAKAT